MKGRSKAKVGDHVGAPVRHTRETPSQVGRPVAEMPEARGYAIDDPVAVEGDDRDVVAEFLAARQITQLVDAGAEGVSPGDVAAAINGYRALYDYLMVERAAP